MRFLREVYPLCVANFGQVLAKMPPSDFFLTQSSDEQKLTDVLQTTFGFTSYALVWLLTDVPVFLSFLGILSFRFISCCIVIMNSVCKRQHRHVNKPYIHSAIFPQCIAFCPQQFYPASSPKLCEQTSLTGRTLISELSLPN